MSPRPTAGGALGPLPPPPSATAGGALGSVCRAAARGNHAAPPLLLSVRAKKAGSAAPAPAPAPPLPPAALLSLVRQVGDSCS